MIDFIHRLSLPSNREKLFIAAIGVITFIILGILAAKYYLERTLFLDIPFHIFHLIWFKHFFIQNNRFGAAFTQTIPLLAILIHAPLRVVMMSYSLSFVIYYFLVFLICITLLKNEKFGLVLLLSCVLIVSDTFYWIQSELPQGIAFLILTLAVMSRFSTLSRVNIFHHCVLLILMIFITYYHPMMVFPYFFSCAFFFTDNRNIIRKKLIYESIVYLVLIMIFKNVVMKPAEYDANAMDRWKNLVRMFPHYIDVPSNRNFVEYSVRDYYFLPLFFIAILIVYFFRRNILKLLLLLFFFLGYLLLVNISFSGAQEKQFYLENLYLPLSFFVIVAFVFDILPSIKIDLIRYGLLILIIIVRLIHISNDHEKFSARINWYEDLLSETRTLTNKKLIIPDSTVNREMLILDWASAYEILLLSSAESPDSSRSIAIDDNPNGYLWAIDQNKSFFAKGGVWPYEILDSHYFRFHDTSRYVIQSYQAIEASKKP